MVGAVTVMVKTDLQSQITQANRETFQENGASPTTPLRNIASCFDALDSSVDH